MGDEVPGGISVLSGREMGGNIRAGGGKGEGGRNFAGD